MSFFPKGGNFCDFLFATVDNNPSRKGSTLKRKNLLLEEQNLLPEEKNLFFVELNPFKKGGKKK